MKPVLTTYSLAVALSLASIGATRAQDSSGSAYQEAVAKAQAEAQQAQKEAEKAQAGVQQQLQKLQQQYQQLQKRFTGEALPRLTERLQSIVNRSPGNGVDRSLVVHSADMDPKAQANLEEDLTVMSHILDKAVEEKLGASRAGQTAMGINVLFAPGATPIRSLYLDGYGALFLLKVGFPLVAPPKQADAEAQKEKSPTDSTWEEAKREVYGQGPDSKPSPGGAPEYSGEKVKQLQDALLESLKNGTNIRGLKPDDGITVCVFGSAANAKPDQPQLAGGVFSYSADPFSRNVSVGDATPSTQRSIMTIRVKKSDVDAFAAGKLTADEFRRKADITTYAADIGGGGGFPFIGGFGGGGVGGGGGGIGGFGGGGFGGPNRF